MPIQLTVKQKKLRYSQSVNIRKATSEDAMLLSDLSRDVQSLHAQNYADIFKIPQSADSAISFFDEMLADPAVSIFIAEENRETIGYILCKLIERPENRFTFAMRSLLVEHISVHPAARGQGVGTALMKEAEMPAKELAVQRIQLDSWDFNTNAHSLFERLGFQKFNFRFWRPV